MGLARLELRLEKRPLYRCGALGTCRPPRVGLGATFFAFVKLASTRIWLRSIETTS